MGLPLTGSARGASQTATLPAGACLPADASGRFLLPDDCAALHAVEVTGVAEFDGRIDHAPGPHELDPIISGTCALLAAQYLGRTLDGDLSAAWLTVDERGWNAGRRKTECLIAHGTPGAFRPVSGSIRSGA